MAGGRGEGSAARAAQPGRSARMRSGLAARGCSTTTPSRGTASSGSRSERSACPDVPTCVPTCSNFAACKMGARHLLTRSEGGSGRMPARGGPRRAVWGEMFQLVFQLVPTLNPRREYGTPESNFFTFFVHMRNIPPSLHGNGAVSWCSKFQLFYSAGSIPRNYFSLQCLPVTQVGTWNILAVRRPSAPPGAQNTARRAIARPPAATGRQK